MPPSLKTFSGVQSILLLQLHTILYVQIITDVDLIKDGVQLQLFSELLVQLFKVGTHYHDYYELLWTTHVELT